MKLKLSFIAAVLLTVACATPQAQTVTIYGLLDTGIEQLNNVGAGGGGLSAVFTIEQRLVPDAELVGKGRDGLAHVNRKATLPAARSRHGTCRHAQRSWVA